MITLLCNPLLTQYVSTANEWEKQIILKFKDFLTSLNNNSLDNTNTHTQKHLQTQIAKFVKSICIVNYALFEIITLSYTHTIKHKNRRHTYLRTNTQKVRQIFDLL